MTSYLFYKRRAQGAEPAMCLSYIVRINAQNKYSCLFVAMQNSLQASLIDAHGHHHHHSHHHTH